jgi:hypothetical protein
MTHSSSLLHQEDPNAIAKRLMQKAHTRDGLPEIAVGITFLVLAGLCWLQEIFKHGTNGYQAASLGMVLLFPALAFGTQWAIKHVRRRFLIKKVGYVEAKPVNRKQRGIVFVIAAAVAAAVTIATYIFIRGSHSSTAFSATGWLLAGTGIIGGAGAAFLGRLPRYVVGGVIMAATGIYLAFSGVSLNAGFAILYGLIGLLSLISGCVVLLLLVRQPAQEGE